MSGNSKRRAMRERMRKRFGIDAMLFDISAFKFLNRANKDKKRRNKQRKMMRFCITAFKFENSTENSRADQMIK
jgi:hypothetical protein